MAEESGFDQAIIPTRMEIGEAALRFLRLYAPDRVPQHGALQLIGALNPPPNAHPRA